LGLPKGCSAHLEQVRLSIAGEYHQGLVSVKLTSPKILKKY